MKLEKSGKLEVASMPSWDRNDDIAVIEAGTFDGTTFIRLSDDHILRRKDVHEVIQRLQRWMDAGTIFLPGETPEGQADSAKKDEPPLLEPEQALEFWVARDDDPVWTMTMLALGAGGAMFRKVAGPFDTIEKAKEFVPPEDSKDYYISRCKRGQHAECVSRWHRTKEPHWCTMSTTVGL